MDKRQVILSAGLDLFTRQGFQETTTAQISKAAGVATGTLFNYFDSKEALMNELYLYSKASLVKFLMSAFDQNLELEERFRELWKNALSWGIHNSRKFQFFEQFSHSPYLSRLTREQGERQFNFMLKLIQQGIDAGVFKPIAPEIHHTAILNLATGFIDERRQSGITTVDEDYLDVTFSIMWDALTIRNP